MRVKNHNQQACMCNVCLSLPLYYPLLSPVVLSSPQRLGHLGPMGPVGPLGRRDVTLKLQQLSQHYEEHARQLQERSEMAKLLQEQNRLLVQKEMRLRDMEKVGDRR